MRYAWLSSWGCRDATVAPHGWCPARGTMSEWGCRSFRIHSSVSCGDASAGSHTGDPYRSDRWFSRHELEIITHDPKGVVEVDTPFLSTMAPPTTTSSEAGRP